MYEIVERIGTTATFSALGDRVETLAALLRDVAEETDDDICRHIAIKLHETANSIAETVIKQANALNALDC